MNCSLGALSLSSSRLNSVSRFRRNGPKTWICPGCRAQDAPPWNIRTFISESCTAQENRTAQHPEVKTEKFEPISTFVDDNNSNHIQDLELAAKSNGQATKNIQKVSEGRYRVQRTRNSQRLVRYMKWSRQNGFEAAVQPESVRPRRDEETWEQKSLIKSELDLINEQRKIFPHHHPTWQVNDLSKDLKRLRVLRSNLRDGESPSMDEVTFRTEINHAVAKGDPGRLLRALRSVQDHVSYIQSLPSNKFITILKLLGSTLLFKDIRDIHLKYRPGPGRCYGAVDGTTLADISEQQVVPFYRLVNIRLAAGAGLPVGVYKPILHYTAIMGEGELAKKISREMAARNVKRDLECFNHSLSALVWNKYGHYRRSVRIAPRHLAAHDPSQLNCVSFTRMYTIGYGGIKEEALEIHRDMASHGISPDKESYYFLMIAMAREADLPGVKDILTRVWGIDVDAIMDGISVDEHFVSSINPTSPVYPDEELLRIVAHCFGINNDVPTALRIVDSISRRYSLPISLNTWEELFRWTYALSRRKLPKGVNGRLPFRSPERLFRTMQAEPYNIQPTFWMYTLLFRNAYRLEDPAKLMGYFEEAIKVFQEKIWKENNKAMAAIEKARAEVRRGIVPATPILILERRQDALGLERRYAEHEMREWFKLFLSLGDNRSQKKVWLRGVGFSWEREMVPNLVRTFERFAPARIAYETTGGWLYFTLRGNEEIVSQLERKVKIEAEKYMKMTGTHFEDAYSRNRNPKKIGSRVTNALGI